MPGRTMPAGRVSGLGELNGYDTGTDAVRDGKGASDWQNPCKPYFADFYFAADLSGDSCRVRGCDSGADPEELLWFLHVLDDFSGIAVVIYVFLQLLLTHTYYGKYVRMLGENETSVKNSGIRFDICRMIICGISGIVFAQVAMIFLFITNGGSAGIGRRYLYPVIAAACLGGINFLKGKGNLRGTVLGSLSMVLLLNLSAGLSLYSYFSYIWEIAILVIAVVIFARERKN